MFDIDNPSDDKAKLIDAVACSFASCQTEGEYQVVKMCIVKFFSAINIPDDEAVYVLLSAAGNCAEADECIDELVEEFGVDAISNAGSIDDFSDPERYDAELMYHLANAYIANYELLLEESGE
nr:MAG TPA: hypothetical protein [Caudoviricetes sp.]